MTKAVRFGLGELLHGLVVKPTNTAVASDAGEPYNDEHVNPVDQQKRAGELAHAGWAPHAPQRRYEFDIVPANFDQEWRAQSAAHSLVHSGTSTD